MRTVFTFQKIRFILVLAILVSGMQIEVRGQRSTRDFIVLTNSDTVFGKTRVIQPKEGEPGQLKVGKKREAKLYPFAEVESFRMGRDLFTVKPDLHSEYSTPYHEILVRGPLTLFGQQCFSCNQYIAVHLELEDGKVICVNKSNYYSEILPYMTKSEKFREAVKHRAVKYRFFNNLALMRMINLVMLYNSLEG